MRHGSGGGRSHFALSVLLAAGTLATFAARPATGFQHMHTWQAEPQFVVPWFETATRYVRAGEVIDLKGRKPQDYDTCSDPACPTKPMQMDFVYWTNWSDGGANGKFGKIENGVFVECIPKDYDYVTHYQAPLQPQVVQITATVNDAGGPETGDDVHRINDPVLRLTVWDFTLSATGDWKPRYGGTKNYTASIAPPADHNGASMAAKIQFHLTSSNEPSRCMNSGYNPLWAGVDLQIREDPDLEVLSGYAETLNTVLGFTVFIDSVDDAPFGSLEAKTMIPNVGLKVASIEGSTGVFQAAIPTDANGNHIPDSDAYWDAYAGDYDAEIGEGTTLGDGLTHYQEYRGFLVQGVWTEGERDSQDLFIYDPDYLCYRGNFNCAALTIVVHLISAAEMNGTSAMSQGGRTINFNARTFSKASLQGANWLHDVDLGGGDRYQAWGIADLVPAGSSVEVDVQQITDDVQRDKPDGATSDRLEDAIRYAITHEMGHGVNVDHHMPQTGGSHTCAIRYVWDEYELARKPGVHQGMDMGGNNSPEQWLAIPYGILYCTDPFNCKGHIQVNGTPT